MSARLKSKKCNVHVWACLFVHACRMWERVCGSVNVKCGSTVSILQSAFLTLQKKSISSFTPHEPNRSCFPDNCRPWSVCNRLRQNCWVSWRTGKKQLNGNEWLWWINSQAQVGGQCNPVGGRVVNNYQRCVTPADLQLISIISTEDEIAITHWWPIAVKTLKNQQVSLSFSVIHFDRDDGF